jgi:hypothetical protein
MLDSFFLFFPYHAFSLGRGSFDPLLQRAHEIENTLERVCIGSNYRLESEMRGHLGHTSCIECSSNEVSIEVTGQAVTQVG